MICLLQIAASKRPRVLSAWLEHTWDTPGFHAFRQHGYSTPGTHPASLCSVSMVTADLGHNVFRQHG
jgi:hypothetical protein